MGDKAENIGIFTPIEAIIQKQKETFFSNIPRSTTPQAKFLLVPPAYSDSPILLT